jgi:uncharacterized protein with HEPN domain
MSKRTAQFLLEDMLLSMEKISAYIGTMEKSDFVNDSRTVDAVVRNLEIIGEAASRIPAEYRDAHPGIPWRKVVGLRNRVIHEYFGVDLEIVWSIVKQDLTSLKSEIARLFPDET